MHPTAGISGFKKMTRKDWESIMDFTVYLSETISEHIKRPKIIRNFIRSSPIEALDIDPGTLFKNPESSKKNREFLQEERKKLRDLIENDYDPEIGDKIKGVLMSVWEKTISKSNTLTRLQNVGRRIYERLIQKVLPFDFAEEETPIWSGEEKKKSIETKLMEHFEEKIKESMRNRIRARMEQKIE